LTLTAVLLPLIFVALLAFEYWRLTVPETVRLRQRWEFETPNGAHTVSDIVELQQLGAIPYLPGGEIGKFKTIGAVPVSFELDGTRYFISSDPRALIGGAIIAGRSTPPISMKGLRGTSTRGFIRRLRRSRARIDVPLERSARFMWVGDKKDRWGGISGSRVRLPAFEAAHPGFRLRRVTYTVTNEPAGQAN
jgi:hypothetical protein